MSGLRKAYTALLAVTLLCTGCSSLPAGSNPPVAASQSDCPPETRALIANDEGRGPPLVMLGGVLSGATGLAPLAGHLAPHRRVIRLQNINVHAAIEDESLPPGYSVRMESCGVSAALDRLGIATPVDLVGYSYGGLIALDLALRHPERVRSVTVIEPPARAALSDQELATPNQVQFARTATGIRGRIPSEQELADFLCIVFGCAAGTPLEQARQLPLWPTALQNRRSLAAAYAAIEYRSPNPYSTLGVPLLYVSGSGTSEFHAAINRRFRQVLPMARYQELPGGHAVPAVSSTALATAILDFTAR